VPLFLGAFVGDIVVSVISPIFSLFATDNGASIVILAILVTLGAFAGLCATFPVARLADRVGKQTVFSVGVTLLGLSCLIFAVSRGTWALLLPRTIMGVGIVSTFSIGLACLTDTVAARLLPRAVAWYTAAMGAGFAVGPLLGGWSATALGFRATFAWAGAVAVVTAGYIYRDGRRKPRGVPRDAEKPAPPDRVAGGARSEGQLVSAAPARAFLASFSNLPASLSVGVAILTFFPLYAAAIGWSPARTGMVLFVRALASALSRPMIRVVHKLHIAPLQLIGACLVIEAATIALLPFERNIFVIAALLVVEGANYGILLTEAQLTIISSAALEKSASSMVLYTSSTAIAQMIGGILVAIFVSQQSAKAALVTVIIGVALLATAFMVLWARATFHARALLRGASQ
jgi:MFS family permease